MSSALQIRPRFSPTRAEGHFADFLLSFFGHSESRFESFFHNKYGETPASKMRGVSAPGSHGFTDLVVALDAIQQMNRQPTINEPSRTSETNTSDPTPYVTPMDNSEPRLNDVSHLLFDNGQTTFSPDSLVGR